MVRFLFWILLAAWVTVGRTFHPGAAATVRINELIPANDTRLTDEDGDSSDWLELVNASEAPIDLRGYGLSDDSRRPYKWQITNPTELLPGRFLVVFASGKNRQPGAAIAVDPASLPALRLRFQAASVVTNNSQQVRAGSGSLWLQRWPNSVVNQPAAVQLDPAAQPRFLADSGEGRPALRFDGVNDVLRWSQPSATNDFTLIAVMRSSVGHEVDRESASGVGGTSGQRWLFGATHGGDQDGGAGMSVGTNGVSVYEHGSSYMPALAVSTGGLGDSWTVVAVTYRQKRPTLWVQGLLVRAGLTSPRRQVWAPTELGAGAYGAFRGDVAEVLVFNQALAEGDVRGVTQFLGQKYGIRFVQPLHTNFQLNADGEQVMCTAPDGTVADRVDFGLVPRDVSLGRQPDGVGPWLLFAQPTPGGSNLTAGAVELMPPVQFNPPGGFQTHTVQLTLSVPHAEAVIRYTTDGSEPGETSAAYTSPLTLGSRATAPNVLSSIPTAGGWQAPAGTVFKGWVIRARAFKPGALSGRTVTHSYFVTPRGATRYSVPVVSLATARKNFFDPATGIYVPGNSGANFSQRGAAWERPVSVEMFETNGLRVIAQESLVSIHGNTSQGFPIKGLDLDAAAGPERRPFDYRFFPDRPRTRFNNLLLRPSGHDNYLAFQRDELMQDLMRDTGAESQASRLAVVFLNGEYWGLHYLKEKQDSQYVREFSGLAGDEFDYLEGYATPRAGDTAAWDSLIQLLAQKNPADPVVYQEVERRMEVANYIDYKAAEIFTYRWDIGNHRFWRPRTPGGRFRWLQFDNDVGWGGFWAVAPAWDFNMLQADLDTNGSLNGHNSETTTFLLRKLVGNPDFRRDFVNRFADLLNSVYLPTNTIARINAFSRRLEPEMAEHAARWRAPGSLTEWRSQVQYLRDFANRRPASVRRHLRDRFKLGPDVTIQASVGGPGLGVVRVSTLAISASGEAPWKGVYFRDHPLSVRAEALPGYRFAGWEGLPGITAPEVVVRPLAEQSVTAMFEAVPLRLAALRTPEGLRLTCIGAAATTYGLERSDDLVDWRLDRTVGTDENGVGVVTFEPGGALTWFRLSIP